MNQIKWYHLAIFFAAVLFVVIIRVLPEERQTLHTCVITENKVVVDQFDYFRHEEFYSFYRCYDQDGGIIRDVLKWVPGRTVNFWVKPFVWQKGD